MNLKRYDLLFIKGDSLLSRTIEAVTDSPYSHVAIVLDELHIAEIDVDFPFSIAHMHYRPDEYDVFRYRGELTFAQMDAMDRFIHERLRTPYDTIQAFSIGLHDMIGTQVIDSLEKMVCSEAAIHMFSAAGVHIGNPSDDPGKLAKSIKLLKIS